MINSVFPRSTGTDDLTIGVWQAALPEPYEMVSKALYEYIRASSYPPKPGDLISLMYAQNIQIMAGEDAWEEVRGAYMSLWSETDYGDAERAWRGLPDLVRKICTPTDLIDWAFHVKSSDIKQFEKPRFVAAYKDVQAQEIKKVIASKPITAIAGNTVKKIGNNDDGDDNG